MGLSIFANIDATSLGGARVVSATDLRSKSFKQFAAGDNVVVDLFLTSQNGLLDIQSYPTVRLGIGSLNARPTGGTWDLGSETGLDYDISASALQTAITSEVAACVVTSLSTSGYVFKCKFNANGARTIPSVDATGLTPSSTVSIQEIVAGDGSTREEWLIRIFQNPIALVDSSWTNISGNGIRGALNLGTIGVYDLLDDNTSVTTTIELEITDADGDIQTIFQAPLTITGEVIGQGVTGVASFGSYATAAQLAAGFTRRNYLFVSQAGSDITGTRNREDLPFLSPQAAGNASQAGDVIVLRDGDFSLQFLTPLAGRYVLAMPNVIGPQLIGSYAFDFEGEFSAIYDVTAATINGYNAKLQYASVGAGGDVSLYNSRITDEFAGATHALILSGGGRCYLQNCKVRATKAGRPGVLLQDAADKLFIVDSEIIAEDGGDGIKYVNTSIGEVQLKDVAIKTVVTGTYTTPKSINCSSTLTTATVQVMGSVSTTHDTQRINFDGGIHMLNSNYDIF